MVSGVDVGYGVHTQYNYLGRIGRVHIINGAFPVGLYQESVRTGRKTSTERSRIRRVTNAFSKLWW